MSFFGRIGKVEKFRPGSPGASPRELFFFPIQPISVALTVKIRVTFVDADDWIEKECCLDVYNFAKATNAEVTLFDYTPTDHQYISQQMFSKPITELSTRTSLIRALYETR